MSNESFIVGRIEEAFPSYRFGVGDVEFFTRATNAAVAALPERDEYPPLARPMVLVTGPDVQTGSWRSRRQVVIAGTMNDLYESVPAWLDKLERFLGAFYWVRAWISLDMGWMGGLTLVYRADSIATYTSAEPRLPSAWTFEAYRDRHDPIDHLHLELVSSRRGFQGTQPPSP